MTLDALRHVILLLLEATLISVLLLTFFRQRIRYGLMPLCVTLGAFQHLQTYLAAALYVEVWPGLFVSPGSAVFFTATLMVTLLIYIRDDAVHARSLILGIVAANITLTLVLLLAQQHLADPDVARISGLDSEFLIQNIQPLIVGTGMLCLDVILIIVLYEFFYRLLPRSLFGRIAAAMVCVVSIDTIVFVTLNFAQDAAFAQILLSGLVGKSAFAIFYSAVIVTYLKLFPAFDKDAELNSDQLRDVFHILTYRQRYEMLKDELSRDALTGVFNRGFFNENLPRELKRAARLGHTLSLMLIDLDNFKQINDRYGHPAGDRVLELLGETMQQVLRVADIPCRYGGEEFAVILPDSPLSGARQIATRLRDAFAEKCRQAELPMPAEFVTFTAGIAVFPDDEDTATRLLQLADQRLYAGKRNGRNCIVVDDLPADSVLA